MSQAVRAQIESMMKSAREMALRACLQPKSEREYMIVCGKVQQLVADARELKEKFLDSDPESQEAQLPDLDDDYDSPPPPRQSAPTRRARPEPDRLQRARERHVPRSI